MIPLLTALSILENASETALSLGLSLADLMLLRICCFVRAFSLALRMLARRAFFAFFKIGIATKPFFPIQYLLIFHSNDNLIVKIIRETDDYIMKQTFQLPKFLSGNAKRLEQQQSSILSAAAIITFASIMSSLAGLVRERVLISAYFDTPASRLSLEAFQVAFQIPDALFQLLILGALSAAFIPVFTKLKKQDVNTAFAMASVVMNYLLVALIFISVFIFIFAEPLTDWRTGKEFNSDQIRVAAQLTRIMLIAQIMFAVSNVLTGMLQSYRRFIMPAIAPILYNLGIILSVVLLADRLGIYAAGIGVLLGAFFHAACQIPLVRRLGYKYQFSFNISVAGVKEVFRLMPPRAATYAVASFQDLFIGFLTTTVGNLSFFVLRLGMRLMTIPIRLFGVPIGQASLAFLAAESEEENRARFRHLLLQSFNQITFFALPASVLLLILRVPIVRLVFGAKNLPWETTVMTGKVVAIIALSVVAQALVQLLIRGFHALKDTKTPFLVSVVIAVMSITGASGFVYFSSQPLLGIAVTMSLAAFLELGLFIWLLERKVGGIVNRSLITPQLTMLLCGFLMAVFLYLPFRILDEVIFNTSKTIELIALTITTSTIGLIVYVYFAALFDVKELEIIQKALTMIRKPRQQLNVPELVTESSSSETSVP